MDTKLISQVAQKVFFKNTNIPEPLQNRKKIPVQDSVEFSKLANAASENNFSAERAYNLERAIQLVSEDRFKLDDKMIEEIAEKIAQMLV